MNAFTTTDLTDAEELAAFLREGDRREIQALTAMPILEVICGSVEASIVCFTWRNEGRVVAIFGVAPTDDPNIGCGWFLGTDEVAVERDFLFEVTPWVFDIFHQLFPVVENFCHADNELAIRWLQRSGFVLSEPVPFGEFNEPFHYFYREAASCAS